MANKAFLCGINEYATPLAGAVNDIVDMADFLHTKCGFKKGDIRLLADKRATTDEILSRLTWLVADAKAGDRLFFMFSGLGTKLFERNSLSTTEEIDEAVEGLCSVDFSWTDQGRAILSHDIDNVYSVVPVGVQFITVLDTSYAAKTEKPDRGAPTTSTEKYRGLPAPVDLEWREQVAKEAGILTTRIQNENAAFISASLFDQVAVERKFNGRANGALTYWLLRALSNPGSLSLPLPAILKMVQNEMKKVGISQTPHLYGNTEICQGSFFGSK